MEKNPQESPVVFWINYNLNDGEALQMIKTEVTKNAKD